MKRRSFLALLGAAPAVALIPAALHEKSPDAVIWGAKITDAKITSIMHGKITSDKIVANAITADSISVGSINVSRLSVDEARVALGFSPLPRALRQQA